MIGRTISRYQIVEKQGEGGMGKGRCGRKTGISESGPHGSRLVGSASVRAVTVSSVASLFFHPRGLRERGTPNAFSFLKPVAVSAAACSTSRQCVGDVVPNWLAENGVILPSGGRARSTSRCSRPLLSMATTPSAMMTKSIGTVARYP